MIRGLLLSLIGIILFLTLAFPAAAQTQFTQTYHKGKVLNIEEDRTITTNGKPSPYQLVKLQLLDGPDKNEVISLSNGGTTIIAPSQKVQGGETLILSRMTQNGKTTYSIVDRYRFPTLVVISFLFFVVVLLLSGKKGIGSIIGLLISLLIIVVYIVPQILHGGDPLIISIIGSLIIMVVTLYLAHGFNQRTTIALASTFISLCLTGTLAILAVNIAKLSGLGSEDAYNLLLGSPTPINLQGLLLGGIIIGALGVLDDTTTTQSTVVAELAEANPSYTVRHLFTRGMVVGREHIASLVNTLVLAYAGASMGIFIFIILSLQSNTIPWWVIFNNEIIAEEVIRTLVGSLGLVLAVPITTLLAAFFAKNEIKIK